MPVQEVTIVNALNMRTALTPLAIFLVMTASPALGEVYQGPDDWDGVITGSRTAAYGLQGSGAWDSPEFSVAWSITPQDAGEWDWLYSYNVSAPVKKVSQLIIQIAQGATGEDFAFTDTIGRIGYYSGNDENPGMPPGGGLFGLKFDLNAKDGSFGFYTDYGPDYGHLYAVGKDTSNGKGKGGDEKPPSAFNQALDPAYITTPGDFTPYVAAPLLQSSRQGAVPIPSSIWLLGGALVGLIAFMRISQR